MLFELESLRFTWWNCGLTPPKGANRGDTRGYQDFEDVISHLIPTSNIIGLCEIGELNIDHVSTIAQSSGWHLENLISKTPNNMAYFDHALLYDPTKVSVEKITDIISPLGTSQIKSGQHLRISTLTHAPTHFDVFLSHWPSKLRGGDEERETAATGLLGYINSTLENSNFICMGDYNESPFSQVMNVKMQSTKCYHAVMKSPRHTIYNPFWKLSVSQKKYTHLQKDFDDFSVGTFEYRSNTSDHMNWYSFDQILVSGNFLGSSEWHLDETETRVIRHETIRNLFTNRESYVDHYPITLKIVHP